MFSEYQKATLLKSKFRTTPRYVRVPLQMVNGVRALRTDVNSDAIHYKFQSSMCLLNRYNDVAPIYHIRADVNARVWLPAYEKICCAYRSLNNSRILRRMKITGFRMVNFAQQTTGCNIFSDHYISGTDAASVVLDSLANLLLPSGRIQATLTFAGGYTAMKDTHGHILSHPCWNGSSWRIDKGTHTNNQSFELNITAGLSQIVSACNVALDVAERSFLCLHFKAWGLMMDTQTDYEHVEARHRDDDINVLLSGYRIRRFQKIGQLTKMF